MMQWPRWPLFASVAGMLLWCYKIPGRSHGRGCHRRHRDDLTWFGAHHRWTWWLTAPRPIHRQRQKPTPDLLPPSPSSSLSYRIDYHNMLSTITIIIIVTTVTSTTIRAVLTRKLDCIFFKGARPNPLLATKSKPKKETFAKNCRVRKTPPPLLFRKQANHKPRDAQPQNEPEPQNEASICWSCDFRW